MVANLIAHGYNGVWLEPEFGQGRTFRFESPDGHHFELMYELERFVLPAGELHPFKALPDRYLPWGIAPKRLDHLNLLAREIQGPAANSFTTCSACALRSRLSSKMENRGHWLRRTASRTSLSL